MNNYFCCEIELFLSISLVKMNIDELFDVLSLLLVVLCEAPLPRTVDACTLTMMSNMLIDFQATRQQL